MIEVAKEQLGLGNLAGAKHICEEFLRSSSDRGEACYVLGLALCAMGDYVAAVDKLNEAVGAREHEPLWHYNLGVAYSAAQRWEEAAVAFRRAMVLGWSDTSGYTSLGRALLETGQLESALDCYVAAGSTVEASALSLCDLGRVYAGLKRHQEAVDAWNRALSLDSNSASVHDHSGELYRGQRDYRRLLEHAEQAARLRPSCALTLARLGLAYWYAGRLEESIAIYEEAVRLDPKSTEVRSGYLFALLHADSMEAERILSQHRAWADSVQRQSPRLPPGDRAINGRLRIGYVSGEVYFTASYFFISSFLVNHNRSSFDTILYYTRSRRDAVTDEMAGAVTTFHDAASDTPEDLAKRIVKDEIDILVDLSGHYPYNGLRTFQMRPVPVQATFPNYPATTGLREMDYLFTDEWTDPHGSIEFQYTEQLWRLPSGYLVYRPLQTSPVETASEAGQKGYITFGLFQRPAKTNSRVWDVIAEILLRTKGSRLLVHFLSQDLEDPRSPVRLRFSGELSRRGVDSGRLDWSGAASHHQHMKIAGSVDIALDTFPYNGQTTTCECLWMGVPTVTLEGTTHVSRVGAALLRRAGLDDWVGSTAKDYVDIAVEKAARIDELTALRARMRQDLLRSSLMNGRQLAAEMEEAYQAMWQRSRSL